MRAAYYEQTGPAEKVLIVGELPTPSPGPGEVLVRVSVSGVNPSDVKSRRNPGGPAFPLVIPHSDGGGVVEAVGEGGDPRRIGQRVWLWNGQWRRPFGTAAEYVALPEGQAVPLPDHVPFDVASCLGIPFLTAWRAVHWQAPPRPGETMLVAGGAGAVGHYAIQLAKRAGFRVATTISSEEKAALAIAAGADLAVNYRSDDLAGMLREFTGGKGLDRIIEVNLGVNAGVYPDILRKEGLVVVYGSDDWTAPLPLRNWLVHGMQMGIFIVYELLPEHRKAAIEACASCLADADFQHRVAARFPLDRIVEAHQAVEQGRVTGNVVLDIG